MEAKWCLKGYAEVWEADEGRASSTIKDSITLRETLQTITKEREEQDLLAN